MWCSPAPPPRRCAASSSAGNAASGSWRRASMAGAPCAGMRPRVVDAQGGSEISPGIVTLIIESEPENSTELFRYQYLKTQDPNERCDKMRRDSARKLFSGAEPFLGSHDGAVRTALARSPRCSSRGALHPRVRAVQPGLSHSLQASRGSPRRTRSIRRPTGTTGCSIPIFPPPWRFSRSVRIGLTRRAIAATPADGTPTHARRRAQNLR